MNGLDCLREEMEKRGLTKAQIESKVAAVVLDILSQSGDKYTKMWQEEQEQTERERSARKEAAYYERRASSAIITIKNAERLLSEMQQYMDTLFDALNKCETPEERARLKAAQMFVNSVNVNTKYDNTAYIIGLAQILAGGNLDGIEELKKINPKLFEKQMKII